MKRIDFEKYNVSTDLLAELIDKWIFSKRDRDVLRTKLIDDLTFEATAEKHDISRGTVVNIVNKGLSIIGRHLN